MTAEGIATCWGIGRLGPAQGTVASVAAIPLAWALHALGGAWLLIPATLALTALGYIAVDRALAARAAPDADPKEFVIDEVVGMLIALWPMSIALTLSGAGPEVLPWPGVLFTLALFRFFDIAKPWPIRHAEAAPGALGVMLDDLLAGVFAAILAALAAGAAHGWF
ncbi:MAG: phosphatidylglycerophosphatase A [Pseudomonadota bacterium]